MSFYNGINTIYDIIFPENPTITSFLADGLSPGSRVLDLGCGTATYACALAGMGHDVTGIDMDPGMIERAREKCGGSASFLTGDMLKFASMTDGETFDRIVCIGNSLPRLGSRDTVQCFIDDAFRTLNNGGDFILQSVHFKSILDGSETALPVIKRKERGIRFVRTCEPGETAGTVRFHVTLEHDGQSSKSSDTLLAFESSELLDMTDKAGFDESACYGAYDRRPFTAESPAIIIQAKKRSEK